MSRGSWLEKERAEINIKVSEMTQRWLAFNVDRLSCGWAEGNNHWKSQIKLIPQSAAAECPNGHARAFRDIKALIIISALNCQCMQGWSDDDWTEMIYELYFICTFPKFHFPSLGRAFITAPSPAPTMHMAPIIGRWNVIHYPCWWGWCLAMGPLIISKFH